MLSIDSQVQSQVEHKGKVATLNLMDQHQAWEGSGHVVMAAWDGPSQQREGPCSRPLDAPDISQEFMGILVSQPRDLCRSDSSPGLWRAS